MGCKAFENEQHNILADAISIASEITPGTEVENKDKIYNFLENTPHASLIVEIVDALTKLGYSIKKNN